MRARRNELQDDNRDDRNSGNSSAFCSRKGVYFEYAGLAGHHTLSRALVVVGRSDECAGKDVDYAMTKRDVTKQTERSERRSTH